MSSDSTSNSSSPDRRDPPKVMKMLENMMARLEKIEQASSSRQNEAERSSSQPVGSDGNAENQASTGVLSSVDEKADSPASEPRSPVVNSGTLGKLDATTLLLIPQFGSEELSYAEQ